MKASLAHLRQGWEETLAPLRQRWLLLEPRQQRLLGLVGLLLGVLLLVYGLWLPSHHAAQNAQSQYESNRALLMKLQAQTGAATGSEGGVANGSVLRLASDSANDGGLVLSRIEPEGESKVRVWLDKADFNAVAAWLAKLSAQGIKLQEAEVEKQNEGGVSTRLVLSR